jgi:type III restriction enzyme
LTFTETALAQTETPKSPWSRKTLNADKCVFNLVPCDNELEREFARFLQEADDVVRFAKTKGLEDVNVSSKDRAAHLWCENATKLTGKPWSYLRVPQTEYARLQPTRFADVAFLASQ